MYLPLEDKYTNRKNELLDRLVVIMGGRVAEELIFGDVTNGATGDIRMATGIARKMVCEWGMSERLGMVEYGEHEDYVFLGRDIARSRAYSEATAQEIDREVKRLCDDSYQRAIKVLTHRKEILVAIAKALLEYETLDATQIREIINNGRLINPPPPISPANRDDRPEPSRPQPEGVGGLTVAASRPVGYGVTGRCRDAQEQRLEHQRTRTSAYLSAELDGESLGRLTVSAY
jgi:cell division protease FtsH